MLLVNYENCSSQVREQLKGITDFIQDFLREALIGVYLHGSLVLDGFSETNSDLDILAVCTKRLSVSERIDLAKFFMKANRTPRSIEISIIAEEHLVPWQYPTPCQFHFSDYWHEKYKDFIEKNDFTHWILATDFTDGDIACHTRLTKQSGICLHGKAISNVFPDVPEEHFWESISYDINNFDLSSENSSYSILTLCRIWSYITLGKIISKYEAGVWAEEVLPENLRYVVSNALNEKYNNYKKQLYKQNDLDELKQYIIKKIRSLEEKILKRTD